MKKLLLLAAALVMSAVAMNAQDLLTKNNGEDIKVIVKEIDAHNVKYVLFSEPNGVLYTMPKSEILMIRYASGRNEVFEIFGNQRSTAPAQQRSYTTGYSPYQSNNQIRYGMKYNELKNIYDYRMYNSGGYEKYSPVWCGVGSFFIPGLGQLICGEAGRGFGQWALSILCNVVTVSMFANGAEGIAVISSLANLGVGIFSIVDATRVAKVKNMYENDLRSLQSSVSVDMYPSFNTFTTQSNGVGVAPGMTLAITF